MHNSSLPVPPLAAKVHSQRLVATIKQTINKAGGAIPFSEFMKQALYAPGLGYYSAGIRKLGAEGDFITAPEISPLFSWCIARQCQPVLTTFTDSVILEFGAGSGIMATEVLRELERLNCLPGQYLILEVSADLRQLQQTTLQTQVPKLAERVRWLDSLPSQPFNGVILANEVLDAMPVQRFRLDEHQISEFYVELTGQNSNSSEMPFELQVLPTCDKSLQVAVERLRPTLPIGYESEINLVLPAFFQTIADILSAGMMLVIDYGFPHNEYYHPQRDQGTLMCHYRHYAHSDPLILVGLQDITAHVNFTDVAEAAFAAGLHVAGYTTQTNFLLANGLLEFLETLEPSDTKTYLQWTQQVKTLTLPSEMGELFKVMALTRNLDVPLQGFSRDERGRL